MPTEEHTGTIIEQSIHLILRDAISKISEQHGIYVTRANVDWIDVSTPGNTRMLIREVRLDTMTKQ